MARTTGRTVRIALILVMLMSVPAAVGGSPAAAQFQPSSDEMRLRVQPDGGNVLVDHQFSIRARTETLTVSLPDSATNVAADVEVEVGESDGFFFPVTMHIKGAREAQLEYTLGTPDRRASTGTRVNDSFAGFPIWPMEGTTIIQVIMPPGFSSDVSGRVFTRSVIEDDVVQYATTEIDAVVGYWFVAFLDSALTSRSVDIGEDIVEVSAWAGDDEWLEFATQYVEEGVPVLRDLIGQPWPENNLRVVESVAPTQAGYAGWYSRQDSQIEVADALDAETLLHELSHAWFNDRTFGERWMIEGFAEEYASAALAQIDDDVTEPDEPRRAPAGYRGLAQWRSRFFFEDNWDEEFYGYETSWFVIDALADEIGQDGMADTIAAMLDGRHPYALESDPALFPENDWRRFLDMLELHGGSTKAEALFREYVVGPEDSELLDHRRAAMASFAKFVDHQSDHEVPPVIRDAMSRWRFGQAEADMKTATELREQILALTQRAYAEGLSVPAVIEDLYENSRTGFTPLQRFLGQTDEILSAIEAGGAISRADARNFELGRFERLDIHPEPSLNTEPGLNQNVQHSELGALLFVSSVLCFALLAVLLWLVLGRLKDAPAPPAA